MIKRNFVSLVLLSSAVYGSEDFEEKVCYFNIENDRKVLNRLGISNEIIDGFKEIAKVKYIIKDGKIYVGADDFRLFVRNTLNYIKSNFVLSKVFCESFLRTVFCLFSKGEEGRFSKDTSVARINEVLDEDYKNWEMFDDEKIKMYARDLIKRSRSSWSGVTPLSFRGNLYLSNAGFDFNVNGEWISSDEMCKYFNGKKWKIKSTDIRSLIENLKFDECGNLTDRDPYSDSVSDSVFWGMLYFKDCLHSEDGVPFKICVKNKENENDVFDFEPNGLFWNILVKKKGKDYVFIDDNGEWKKNYYVEITCDKDELKRAIKKMKERGEKEKNMKRGCCFALWSRLVK